MKYTVMGLDQQGLVDAGLDLTDTAILRYFLDFAASGAMVTKTIDGEVWYWMQYRHLIEELPLLGLTGELLRRRMVKLELSGMLQRNVQRDKTGSWMYVRAGAKLAALLSPSQQPTPTESGPPPLQKVDPSPTESGPIDPSPTISPPVIQRLNGHSADFATWYAAYPRHVGRKAAERAYLRSLKDTTVDKLLLGAKRIASEGREIKYTPHPATWLNQGRWDDDPPPTSGYESRLWHKECPDCGWHSPDHSSLQWCPKCGAPEDGHTTLVKVG